MAASTLIKERQTCFQLKTSFLPCTILQLISYDLAALEQQLTDAIAQAPNFFIGAPVVIDLEKIRSYGALNFTEIKRILLNAGMVPVGVRGGDEEQLAFAAVVGLPALSVGKSTAIEKEKDKEIDKEVDKKKIDERTSSAKIVTAPIRSGMQVYAKDADLIVTAQVSPGAELLADGHIHVYGALRGRALAGVQGNTNVRIFCRTLEAELVSIAGYYLTKEDICKLPAYDGMIQIYLENEQVKIESI